MEQQIVSEFYDRRADGIPGRWIERVRLSMAELTPRFSTNRMVQEYVDRIYLPAASSYRARAAKDSPLACELYEWQQAIEQHWPKLGFGKVNAQKKDNQWEFEAEVEVSGLDTSFIRVEIYADRADNSDAVREPMQRVEKLPGRAWSTFIAAG